MSDFRARWGDIAIDQSLTLAPETQSAVDDTIRRLLADPSGSTSSYDPASDQWTAVASDQVMVVYVFRPGKPWLVVLRLVVMQ